VQKFIDAMEGEIHVSSEPNKGSKFTVVLPFEIPLLDEAEYKNKDVVWSGSHSASLVSSSLNITSVPNRLDDSKARNFLCDVLLVEDNSTAQYVTKVLLTSLNCHVKVASNGEEALRLFSTEKFDLIFLDIGLPDMDGENVVKLIRAKEDGKSKVPIIVLTAHVAQEAEKYYRKVGVQAVLSKPLSYQRAQEILDTFHAHHEVFSLPTRQEKKKMPILKDIDFISSAKQLGTTEVSIRKILDILIESLPNSMDELTTVYTAKDLAALTGITHKLMGGLCYSGTPRLQYMVKMFNRALKRDGLENLPELYNNVQHAVASLYQAHSALTIHS